MGRLEAMVTGVHAILIDMDRDKLCLFTGMGFPAEPARTRGRTDFTRLVC